MNKGFFVLLIILFSLFFNLLHAQSAVSQENDLLEIDLDNLDSIFDTDNSAEEQENEKQVTSVLSDVKKYGVFISLYYYFSGAANPGWDMYPWDFNGDETFSWALGIGMGSSMTVNAQISDSFRVLSTFSCSIPGFAIGLGDFFFDYNFYNKVFLRAGKYEHGWGISPNFGFTNMLSRMPILIDEEFPPAFGPSYVAKFDIPIGIGGLQLLALTRYNIAAGGRAPPKEYFGYGTRFSLPFNWADFILAFYYQQFMATRGSFSVKTNIFKFDIYNEWLVTYNNHTDSSVKLAFNIGFSRTIFSKFDINAEYFYNGEETTEYYRPETEFRVADTSPFLHGDNFALNLLYRFDGRVNPRVYTRLLYGDESYSMAVGVAVSPLSNMSVHFAMPIVLGSKDSHYYRNSFNVLNEHRPFSFVLYVSFSGGASL